MSKPVFSADEPWKHVTSFPPNPKLITGTRTEVRPSGSLVPSSDGEGAYAPWVGAERLTIWVGPMELLDTLSGKFCNAEKLRYDELSTDDWR